MGSPLPAGFIFERMYVCMHHVLPHSIVCLPASVAQSASQRTTENRLCITICMQCHPFLPFLHTLSTSHETGPRLCASRLENPSVV